MCGAALSASAAETETSKTSVADSFRREIQPVLKNYCYDCHGDGMDKGGVVLDDLSPKTLTDHELWSRVLRNVRAGLMPPAEEENPLPPAEAGKIMAWIKHGAFGLDPAKPDPGRVTVRRLNRVEYRNTIRDLTGVDFETEKEFPADDTGHGFDNIADVLTVSPMLTEKYLDAAQAIIAKGVVTAPRSVAEKTIAGREFRTIKVDTKVPEQPKPETPANDPIAALAANLPSDGANAPAATPSGSPTSPANPPRPGPTPPAGPALAANTGQPERPGQSSGAPGRGPGRGFGFGNRPRTPPPAPTRPAPTIEDDTLILSYYTPATVAAKHRVEHAGKYQIDLNLVTHETFADGLFDLNKCQVTFTLDGETLLDREFVREGAVRKFDYTFERELAAGEHEVTVEIKPLDPAAVQYRKLRLRLSAVTFRGPAAAEHWVRTPGYDRFFPRDTPPADAAGRRAYAHEILEKFTTRAFRRPAEPAVVEKLVALAERVYSHPTQTFESGVAQAMVGVLAHPHFLFREDRTEPRQPGQAHPLIDEYSLASRLSYFLWSTMPDEELIRLARQRQLRAQLPAQLKRMLADAKAEEFVRNFTGQWLQARDIMTVQLTSDAIYLRDHPNPEVEQARELFQKFITVPREQRTAEQTEALQRARMLVFQFQRQPKPELSESLRRAMREETEMTFAHILREDRSLLELLDSNYTFLNEALAKHYGVEGVSGKEMRKVELPPDSPRGGVLTQGTVLAVTSNPTRTSPVKRGVFILEAILGTPPAPPPPNIPSLEDAASPEQLRTLTLRDTLALHAQNPTCASCHSRMDPLGLALENFNAMGIWRTADSGQPVQPAGKLVTGETFTDVRELKRVLATSRHRDFYHSIAEKLLTYALGRSVEYYDTTTLDQLVDALEQSGGRPSVLIAGIVNSAAFQRRREIPPANVTDASLRSVHSPQFVQAQTHP